MATLEYKIGLDEDTTWYEAKKWAGSLGCGWKMAERYHIHRIGIDFIPETYNNQVFVWTNTTPNDFDVIPSGDGITFKLNPDFGKEREAAYMYRFTGKGWSNTEYVLSKICKARSFTEQDGFFDQLHDVMGNGKVGDKVGIRAVAVRELCEK